MPDINLRDLTSDIRDALEKHSKESLIEILTYVFKEYVVEGSAPLVAASTAQRDDLEGMSFAEIIRSLQLRLDLPELALFEVTGEAVALKLGGRVIPVEAQSRTAEPFIAPPPPPASLTAPSPVSVTGHTMPTAPHSSSSAAASREAAPITPGSTREEMPTRPAPARRNPIASFGSGGSEISTVNTQRQQSTPLTPAQQMRADAQAERDKAASAPAAPSAAPGGVAKQPNAPTKEDTAPDTGRFNLLEID